MKPADPSPARPWVVCERANRWTSAVQRFLAELVPPRLISRLGPVSRIVPADVSTMLSGQACNLVLWEVDPGDFVTSCDWITQTAIAMPRALQLAAVAGLSGRELIVLSELGVAATVRHPEHLPSLRRMIHGHFARVA